MDSNSIYYVYIHSRLSNGEPFYVGKGKGRRVTRSSQRGAHWKAVVAKAGGFYASILVENIDEELSLLIECEVIASLRRRGIALINKTNGGDGVSGLRHTAETRAQMALSKLGNKASLGHRASDETRAKMSATRKGKPGNRKGCVWTDAQRQRLSQAHFARHRRKENLQEQ